MIDDQKSDDDYKVGYGHPPEHTRFRPGQSGNPRGRPRKSKGFADLMQRELDKKIDVREAGEDKRVTKREALVTRLVNCAIKGDIKPLQLVLAHLKEHREIEPFVPTEADDAALLQALTADESKEDDHGKR